MAFFMWFVSCCVVSSFHCRLRNEDVGVGALLAEKKNKTKER